MGSDRSDLNGPFCKQSGPDVGSDRSDLNGPFWYCLCDLGSGHPEGGRDGMPSGSACTRGSGFFDLGLGHL